jgi:pilus assembly protein CpaE
MPKLESIVNNEGCAVFCVAVEGALAGLAIHAAETAGAKFAGGFPEYFRLGDPLIIPGALQEAALAVAIVDMDNNFEAALETAEVLQKLPSPRVLSVAISGESGPDAVLRAMRAGFSEFLSKPVTGEQLAEVVSRFQERQTAVPTAQYSSGKVITLSGVKGGVGTTTLAVHLALALQKKFNKNTLLLDHHMQLGHVCLQLGLKPGMYHFDELCRNVDRLDAELLRGLVTRHSSGLDVVGSTDICTIGKAGAAEEVQRVLNFLRRQYDFVIIDSSVHEDDLSSQSDEIFMVATPDVAAVRDAARFQDRYRLYESLSRRVRIVLNRANQPQGLTTESVEDTLGCSVIAIANQSSDLLRAVNSGEPLDMTKKSEFMAGIVKWAERLAGPSSETVIDKKAKFPLWRLAGATR